MCNWRRDIASGRVKTLLVLILFWMGSAHAENWLTAKCVVEGGWAARIFNGEKVHAYTGLAQGQKELRHEYNYKIDMKNNKAIITQGGFLVSSDAAVTRLATGTYVLHCPSPVGSFGSGFEIHSLIPEHGIGIIQKNTYPVDPHFDEKILEDSYSMTCSFVNEN